MIVVTLAGQGTLLPVVLKQLGLVTGGEAEGAAAKVLEIKAPIAGVDAALGKLSALAREGAVPAAVALLRQRYQARRGNQQPDG